MINSRSKHVSYIMTDIDRYYIGFTFYVYIKYVQGVGEVRSRLIYFENGSK
jgi:hypothetical protein